MKTARRTRVNRIARRPSASLALCVSSLALVGCPGDVPHEGMDGPPVPVKVAGGDSAAANRDAGFRIDLLELFDGALVRVRAARADRATDASEPEPEEPRAGAGDPGAGPVVQRDGSNVAFHVILPAAARLSARGTLRGEPDAEASVRVTLATSGDSVAAGAPEADSSAPDEPRTLAAETDRKSVG